jgi:uncharacterized integral membrane protein
MTTLKINQFLSIEKNRYILFGIFLLLLQFLLIYANFKATRFDVFFWFCNHTPLILGMAFLFRKKDFIKGLINVGFIAQFLWTLDFLSRLLTGNYIFKVTQYIFEEQLGAYILIPIGIHMLSINLALFLSYKRKPKLKTLLYSLVYIILLFAITLTYTLPERNVNCIQEICGIPQYTFPSYTFFWPAIVFFVIVLPTHGLQYLIYKLHKKKSIIKSA